MDRVASPHSPTIRYNQGTVVLEHFSEDARAVLKDWIVMDPRTLEWRAEARRYRDIVLALRDAEAKY